ncbi:MAG: LysR family transcriptional regulator (chromosome initiation inhibitor) [Oceanospirillaceae bacterium]|jgi:LysR family transcriptional regulator (chromosome initiation inhibitor)
MIDAKGLSAFTAVVSQRSFERAAVQLCITQSAVSQRIKSLEEHLGQSLLIRSGQIKTTTAGQSLLKYANSLQLIERSLMNDLAPRTQSQWLKIAIATNADTLATWLLSALAPWCIANKVLLDLKVDDQDQTHQLLRSGEVIGCISSIEQVFKGCVATPLGALKYHCVASAEFIEKYFAKGVTRNAFKKAPMVVFNYKDQLQHEYLKRFFNLNSSQQLQHFIPSSEGYIEWIMRSMGFGMAPKLQIQRYLDSGELCLLTPEHSIQIPLYWQHWGVNTDISRSLAYQIERCAQLAHHVEPD